MNYTLLKTTLTLGGLILINQLVSAETPDAATDPRIDPQVRSFLAELNKDSSPFWELPQPKPQEILTELQNKTPVDALELRPSKRRSRKMDGR
jgi:acetyl esterase